jgi:hypothetical protein
VFLLVRGRGKRPNGDESRVEMAAGGRARIWSRLKTPANYIFG